MKVSAFRSVTDSKNPMTMSVLECLGRIKDGNSYDKVMAYRNGNDAVKKTLPGYCFSGQFSSRDVAGLIEHSGLITLDFDKMSPYGVKELKDSVCDLPFVYSAFISPSGNGLKVLVRIPKDAENHKKYFNSLRTFFDNDHFDGSGNDVARFCFESYDPDIYINEEAIEWRDMEEEDITDIGFENSNVLVPVSDEGEIISRLQVWFDKKYGLIQGQRNDNLFKFAAAMSDFGVSLETAQNYLNQFATRDFTIKEIGITVRSAYKRNPQKFGSLVFENIEKRRKIEQMITAGYNKKEIKMEFGAKINIDAIKEAMNNLVFWEYDDRGKCKLSPHKFKEFLQHYNFYKFFPAASKTFVFIRIQEHLIEETTEDQIKDFVLQHLEGRREEIGTAPFDLMAGNPRFFTNAYLSMLDSMEVDIKKDTRGTCYIYFRNCVVEITADTVKEIGYYDFGNVWKNQVIDRDYRKYDHHKAEFRKFVWLVSGERIDRYESFRSVIGYLTHSYKTSSNNKAIIFNDETISESPNGGSGKGVFWNALAKIKKVSMIDGKTFNFEKTFPYQTVKSDTQILVFDDVKKNFNFESLFSVITEGITLEYKNQDAIKIPIDRSPKILITTNYTIGGVGSSHERRKFEVEMSAYFGVHRTPEDEFGHMLFDDWDLDEWSRFDNYIINSVQMYLKRGLVASGFHNLEARKFIKEANMEFYEWSRIEEGNLPENKRLYKGEKFNQFVNEYPDYLNGKYKLSQKRFAVFLQKYCEYYKLEITEGRDMNGRWFELTKKEKDENNR